MTKRKSISYLIEAEMEKATVLMASKAITDKLERIAKELAKMIADDVIPLGDSMRDLFGAEQASSFETGVSEKINGLLDQVRTARNEISDQIDSLEKGEPMNDMNTMSDDDMFPAKDDGADAADAGAFGDDGSMDGGDAGVNGDDPFGMGGAGEDDTAFGGEAADPNFAANGGAAGRIRKESRKPTKKVLEADQRLVRQFTSLLREGKTVSQAANLLSKTYALDVETVVGIITKVKKG